MPRLPRRFADLARLPLAVRFRAAGVAVAVVGLSAAAWVRLTAVEDRTRAVPFDRLKVEERQLEMIGGKFAVEAAKFDRWFEGLWVGPNLAVTLAVLTLVAAALCFWLARVAAREPVGDDTPPGL